MREVGDQTRVGRLCRTAGRGPGDRRAVEGEFEHPARPLEAPRAEARGDGGVAQVDVGDLGVYPRFHDPALPECEVTHQVGTAGLGQDACDLGSANAASRPRLDHVPKRPCTRSDRLAGAPDESDACFVLQAEEVAQLRAMHLQHPAVAKHDRGVALDRCNELCILDAGLAQLQFRRERPAIGMGDEHALLEHELDRERLCARVQERRVQGLAFHVRAGEGLRAHQVQPRLHERLTRVGLAAPDRRCRGWTHPDRAQ